MMQEMKRDVNEVGGSDETLGVINLS